MQDYHHRDSPYRAYGLQVLRARTLSLSFDNMLQGCVELEGVRDPKRVMELMGMASAEANKLVGEKDETDELVEFMESDEGRKMLALQVKAQVIKLKMTAWGVVDSVIRWIEEDEFAPTDVTAPLTRQELTTKFGETMEEWLALDRPELMFAARCQDAKDRLDGTPVRHLKTVDFWGTALVLLNGHGPA